MCWLQIARFLINWGLIFTMRGKSSLSACRWSGGLFWGLCFAYLPDWLGANWGTVNSNKKYLYKKSSYKKKKKERKKKGVWYITTRKSFYCNNGIESIFFRLGNGNTCTGGNSHFFFFTPFVSWVLSSMLRIC